MENQPIQPTEAPEASVPIDPIDERLQNAPESTPDLMFDPEARQAQADHAAYMDTRPGDDVTSTDQYNQHFDEKRSEHLDSTTKDYQDMTFYEMRKELQDVQRTDRPGGPDKSKENEIYRMMPDKQLAKLAAFSRHYEDKKTQDRVYEEVFDRIKMLGEEANIDEEQAVGYFEGIIDKAERSMSGEKTREPEDGQDQAGAGAEGGAEGAGAGAEQASADQERFAKEVNDYTEDLLAQNGLYLEHLGIMKNYHDALPDDHDNKANPHTDPAKYRSMLREAAKNNVFNTWVDKSYKDKLDSDETLQGLRTPDQASMQKQAIRKKELLDESRLEVYRSLTAPQETAPQPAEEGELTDEDITQELPGATRPQTDPVPPPYSPPEPGRRNPNGTEPTKSDNPKRNAAKAKIRSIARKSPVKIRRKTRRPNGRPA